MPIYEYECSACGHRLEVIQKVSDSALIECPACGERHLRKLVTAAAFRLKGTGWYETDFKHGGKKDEKKKEATKGTGANDSKTTTKSKSTKTTAKKGD